MDGVRERKKHIGRDAERMREVYFERDRVCRDYWGYREKHL